MAQNLNTLAVERSAHLDAAHGGDIVGALGTIRQHDRAPRHTWRARLLTLLAVMGPGLIVMVGDNDAGGIATYTQAGQNYASCPSASSPTSWRSRLQSSPIRRSGPPSTTRSFQG